MPNGVAEGGDLPRPAQLAATQRRVRLVTYNVHSCRGGDRRLSPDRILSVLRALEPQVVALQEIDRLEYAEYFGEKLGMQMYFVAAREHSGGLSYGNVLLSALPSVLVKAGGLPRLHSGTEARAAQWMRVDSGFGALDIVNTHLGLLHDERVLQAECLLGGDWLGSETVSKHAVLCGDLNVRPGTSVYARLCRNLLDAQLRLRRPKPTFPAFFPVVRIDHVFSSRTLAVTRVDVPSAYGARWASDHRPLVVDLVAEQERSS
jgi:endonuclease/exonuclease/phosphatase family metal-dependent hydrolase